MEVTDLSGRNRPHDTGDTGPNRTWYLGPRKVGESIQQLQLGVFYDDRGSSKYAYVWLGFGFDANNIRSYENAIKFGGQRVQWSQARIDHFINFLVSLIEQAATGWLEVSPTLFSGYLETTAAQIISQPA